MDSMDCSPQQPHSVLHLCRYCTLLNSNNAANRDVRSLPAACYSQQVLDIATKLLQQTQHGDEVPSLAHIEGLPCRSGGLDAPVAYFESLLLAGPQAECHQIACEHQLGQALLQLCRLQQGTCAPLDLSPAGVLSACSALASLCAAKPQGATASEPATVHWLLSLLAPEHVAALIVWPTQFAGNRKGVARLLEAACVPLQQPLINADAAPNDSRTKGLATALQVRRDDCLATMRCSGFHSSCTQAASQCS